LVHGGSHAADCWDPTVSELARQAPGLRVLAVDLPGRGAVPGDLATLTVSACVDSVVAQIDAAGIERVVLVGHSMAGITVPGVAAALGADRLVRTVFVSCCVPPEGKAVIDTLHGPLRMMARLRAQGNGVSPPMPRRLASWFFCNGMSPEQRAFVLGRIYAESSKVTLEPVHRSMPAAPRTWILTERDRSLRPRAQRHFIDNLGGVDEVVSLDTCHDAMVSAPAELAALLIARTRDCGVGA